MSCKPIAIFLNLISINFAIIPIPTHTRIKISGEAVLKKDRNLFICYFLKKLSTNSYLLKTCRSSIFSPTPMYFTGI